MTQDVYDVTTVQKNKNEINKENQNGKMTQSQVRAIVNEFTKNLTTFTVNRTSTFSHVKSAGRNCFRGRRSTGTFINYGGQI